MSKVDKNTLLASYRAARESGDWKEAGRILIELSTNKPCTCDRDLIKAGQPCSCGHRDHWTRPATPEELMLSGC